MDASWETLGNVHFQASSSCWLNSDPWGYRTVVLISLLAVFALRGCPHPFLHFLTLKPHQQVKSFSCLTYLQLCSCSFSLTASSAFLYGHITSDSAQRNFFACKASCDKIGPIRVIQVNIPILRFSNHSEIGKIPSLQYLD